MKKYSVLIILIMLWGIMPFVLAVDTPDVNPGFSAPNVLSIDNEEDLLNINPSARGNIRYRWMSPLYIVSDTYTSGGAELKIGVNPAVIPSIEPGTAAGQLLYWDAGASQWKHTEVTEAWWDDTNKGLGISLDSATYTPTAYLAIANAAIDTTSSRAGIYLDQVKTAGATNNGDDIYSIYSTLNMNDADSTIGDLCGIKSDTNVTSCTLVSNVGGINFHVGVADDIVENAFAIEGSIHQTAGTIGQYLYGLYIIAAQDNGAIITSNAYGIYLEQDYDGTVTGSTYGIYINDGTGQDYGIYQNGTAPSYYGGSIQAQGGVTAGDSDTAGTLTVSDGTSNYVNFGTPARAADLTLNYPTTNPGTYDGIIDWAIPIGIVSVGTWKGDKQHFFGNQLQSISADAYIFFGNTQYSATIGMLMMRAGTITGISASGAVGAGAGGVDIEVWTGGAKIGTASVTLTAADPDVYTTFALGTNNFVAGTELQIYANFPAVNPAATLATVLVDIEYQTR